MKFWIKISLGVVGLLILFMATMMIWQWESVSILLGTGNVSNAAQTIPEAPEVTSELKETGPSDWPCWRGLNGDARSRVTGIRKDWSSGLAEAWAVDFLCQGKGSATWAAPVIQGDRLITCGRDETQDWVFCLNTQNGYLLWKKSYPSQPKDSHGKGMRATPYIDEDRVYTFGRAGDLVCWSLTDGNKIWHQNVNKQGGVAPRWDHSSSPLIYGELVIIQGGGQTRVIAYDKLTGDVQWKVGEGDAGYAPVVATTIASSPALLAFHGAGLVAIDPNSKTELWDISWETSWQVNATTPITLNDQVFITSGYGTGAQLLNMSTSKATPAWKNKTIASHHSDGYIIDGYLYSYSGQSMQNKGSFKCVELANGKEQWSTNEMGWGTCVYVDEHLLCQDIKGNLFLMKPDPQKFIKVTNVTKALGDVKGPVWTLPVIANDKLYLRFKQRLVCFDICE